MIHLADLSSGERRALETLARARGGPPVRPPSGRRWTAQRKIDLMNDIAAGEITRLAAFTRYGVTDDELHAWERQWAAHGTEGLKATKLQEHRS